MVEQTSRLIANFNFEEISHFSSLLYVLDLVQVTKFKKYKTWDPKVRLYIVIVLSCPLIGSLSSSTANQRAAQNNYRTLGFQDLYFLNFVTYKVEKI